MKLSPTKIFEEKKIFYTGSAGLVAKIFFSSVIILGLTSAIYACEPAVPLGQIALFPGAIAKSLYLLIATVIVKTVAFVFFEKSLVWWKAILFIFLANIFTTIVGVIAAIPVSMTACFPFFIVSGLLAYIPAKGLAQKYFSKERQKSATNFIAVLLALISLASGISFMAAKHAIEIGNLERYWVAKIICVYLGLIFGILITIFYEEWCVAGMARRKSEPTPFLTSVTRANLIALLFMMIVTAIIVIPEKIQNQDYGFIR